MWALFFQIDQGKTASAARNSTNSAPKQTWQPLPCLLIPSFFYARASQKRTGSATLSVINLLILLSPLSAVCTLVHLLTLKLKFAFRSSIAEPVLFLIGSGLLESRSSSDFMLKIVGTSIEGFKKSNLGKSGSGQKNLAQALQHFFGDAINFY